MFIETNPNPNGSYASDCMVRAISIATNKSWNETYINLCLTGLMMYDMPSSNRVWSEYLRSEGYTCHTVNDIDTVRDFCNEYFRGTYIIVAGTRVIAVKNGNYYDTSDSGDETPMYYWIKER